MATIFLNGRFVEPGEALVSALDAGLTHGVGLFETMSGGAGVDGPAVVRLHGHMARLAESARVLRLTDELRRAALAEAVLRTVERCGLARQRVRLTITGGDLNLLSGAGRGRQDPTVLIVAQEATAYPEAMFERGVAAGVADARANPLDPMAAHKTLNYWWRLSALRDAGAKGGAEALVFQVTNHLCGGCVSSAFVVKDGVLSTPIARGEETGGGLSSPVLPGVTRAAVIDAAVELGIEVSARMLTIDDVLGADELFLTNSSWGVLPVVAVESRAIGGGAVGEMTRRLREALRAGSEEA
jgi:branched-subunit amino acid aminotransferase/4-amino-4-deoxychorismate lyase